MSRISSSNKKRRLESEQSQASGITNLSEVTQTTDLTSEFDDSISDSSTNNINNGFSPFPKNSEETKAKYSSERSFKQVQRKRQVSWYEDNEDDDDEAVKRQAPVFFTYDNNFNGTNDSRRRTRRATEGSLGNPDFSYFQPTQSRTENTNSNCNSPLRSNTTSQIHGHENDIQRQRMIESLMKQITAQEYKRRSKSETCLQNSNLHVRPFPRDNYADHSNENTYESLTQQTVRKSPAVSNSTAAGGPVDTVVTIPNGGPNYIHPVTQVQRQTNPHDLINNVPHFTREEEHSHSGDSNYIDVRQNPGVASPVQVLSCQSCSNTFFRKGFYVLLVLNVIFLLLNVVGLPFLYFAMKQDENVEPPSVGAQTANVCVKCDSFPINERNRFKTQDNNCCGSVEELFPSFLRATEPRIRHIEGKIDDTIAAKVPVIQLRADTNKLTLEDSTITWREREDINSLSVRIVNRTSVVVPKSGYYYVYSRIHYKKTDGNNTSQFTIGHKVMKTKQNGRPKQIDKIEQRCLPTSNMGDVRHTNHLSSIQYLEESERVFIQLDHTTYFDPHESVFGMFLVAT